MKIRLKKCGSGASVEIPAAVLKAAGLRLGQLIGVRVESGVIVIAPLRRKAYGLAELVGRMKRSNLHKEIYVGGRIGKELW